MNCNWSNCLQIQEFVAKIFVRIGAVFAFSTLAERLRDHMVPWLDTLHSGPDRLDDSGTLVAGNERELDTSLDAAQLLKSDHPYQSPIRQINLRGIYFGQLITHK